MAIKFDAYQAEQDLRSQETELACFHCGEQCPDRSIAIGEKFFCCNGCKTVYEILNVNELCEYYEIEDTPGISPKTDIVADRFSYLDDESVRSQVLEFSDGSIDKVTFHTPAMHCASCIWLLEKLHDMDPRVISSIVNFPKKEVSISYKREEMSLSEAAALLSSLGYEPLINLDTVGKREQSSAEKKLYLRIGLAGFAFGNVMILSFPEYLSRVGDVDPVFKMVFGYLSLLLSLPVLLYSAKDYYSSAWAGIRSRTVNIDVPITLGIGMLFIRSVWEIVTRTGPGYLDSFTGLVFFLLVGRIFQQKTYDLLSFERDYRSFFPLSVTRKINNVETSVPVSKLLPGDRIVVRNQELIPADSVLLKSNTLIDYSFVTGESDPVTKQAGDFIYAGGRQVGTTVELEVIKEPSQSYLTQLWNNDVFNKPRFSRLNQIVNQVSHYFTIGVVGIATVAALYWLQFSAETAIKVFTAVLIVACPCALALSSPFALGTALRIFGRKGFYVKNTEGVEALSKVDTIIMDKTGTLTENQHETIEFKGSVLSTKEQQAVRSLTKHSTHPLSQKIFHALGAGSLRAVAAFEELSGRGLRGTVDDCVIMIGSASWVQLTQETQSVEDMKTRVYLRIDDEIKGYFLIANTYRKGLRPMLATLASHFKLVLLSGDTEREKPTLVNLFGKEDDLYFRQTPEDKLNFVSKAQEAGAHVLMVGDGLNDAGALRASEVGVAVTDDVSAFSPASDAILTGDKLNDLDSFIQMSKATMSVIIASFIISILYNVIGVGFAVSAKLSPLVSAILMPASSISVVVFTTLATSLRAKMMRLT
ncbi:MAG: heavy metal translocating P-type ATPase metal-binding domain-containing protein [Candidatus Marinimicrobia bacterium]|nr:heavy metal translocating P-type ATPase metal-binding domain-containing protein [Candidatus Neomarinimicrobiota bacterium]MCF7903592.1 heavy metal translocating P-type ATPase metal-binding domain-containing protein [Candidatus Neomarinimicrobiota bacterium]